MGGVPRMDGSCLRLLQRDGGRPHADGWENEQKHERVMVFSGMAPGVILTIADRARVEKFGILKTKRRS